MEFEGDLSLLVGGNNSGKSSILQALATWQFCKTILEIEKGRKAWIATSGIQGVGMGIVDFTPMNVPSLAHLWSNLKTQKTTEVDGYTLKIKVTWDNEDGEEKFLEVGMSLANDRLFLKNTGSNLTQQDITDVPEGMLNRIPNIAYLPPFAGITDRETRLTPAMRSRLIGQGLSGGVIRNVLFDLHETNRLERIRLRGTRSKIKNSDLKLLRDNDPWEILQRTMQEVFGTELKITPFNERYHSYLKIECIKGAFDPQTQKFNKFGNYSSRDLMVEGSGFLQWLSVYALSLSPEYDSILLDEPDAHLHPILQEQLVSKLGQISLNKGKQILLATHSTELIRGYDHNKIFAIKSRSGKYLSDDNSKVGVLAGIGAIHTPTLHSIMRHKKLLIVEGSSDERFLRKLATQAGIQWPNNIVPWFWTGKHSERFQLFKQLQKDIPDLQAISIRDRDDDADASVGADLIDKDFKTKPGFIAMKWRRRHIENYLFSKSAISRCAIKQVEEVEDFFGTHGLVIPDNICDSDVAIALRDARGKEILNEGPLSARAVLNINRDKIAQELLPHEVADDIKTFLTTLSSMCASAQSQSGRTQAQNLTPPAALPVPTIPVASPVPAPLAALPPPPTHSTWPATTSAVVPPASASTSGWPTPAPLTALPTPTTNASWPMTASVAAPPAISTPSAWPAPSPLAALPVAITTSTWPATTSAAGQPAPTIPAAWPIANSEEVASLPPAGAVWPPASLEASLESHPASGTWSAGAASAPSHTPSESAAPPTAAPPAAAAPSRPVNPLDEF